MPGRLLTKKRKRRCKLTTHHDAATYFPDSAFRRWFQIFRGSGRCRLLPGGESIGAQVVLMGDHPVSHSVTHFKSQLGGELVTNLVVVTPGTLNWRARSVILGAYRGARRRAGSVVRRLHHRTPA